MTKRKKNKPVPIAMKPIEMKSRKKARRITSRFHKLTHELTRLQHQLQSFKNKDQRSNENSKKHEIEAKINQIQSQLETMGGRTEYQRASQLSTKFHSTTKWVLKVLTNNIKWLPNGRPIVSNDSDNSYNNNHDKLSDKDSDGCQYQTVNILEIGAINIELQNAALQTKRIEMKKSEILQKLQQQDGVSSLPMELPFSSSLPKLYKHVPYYNIKVKSIDLQSTHPLIEQCDFLTMNPPPTSQPSQHYDVIVCSMVLNCIPTPSQRGKMLNLMYQHLNNHGICFLTIPRLCIELSKYMNREFFEDILVNGIGFEIVEKKDSPKVAFWVLRKNKMKKEKEKKKVDDDDDGGDHSIQWKEEWSIVRVLYKAKKYRNEFAVSICHRDDYTR